MNIRVVENPKRLPRNCLHCTHYNILTGWCSRFQYVISKENKVSRRPSNPRRINKCRYWGTIEGGGYSPIYYFQKLFFYMKHVKKKFLYFASIVNLFGLTNVRTYSILRKLRDMKLVLVTPVLSKYRKNYIFQYHINPEAKKIFKRTLKNTTITVVL